MRAVLISLPEPGEGPMPTIAGKTLARRQLLFAKEVGCTSVIAFGGGASPEAIDLRHSAERMGMKYQVISTSHALPGIIGNDDSLLVLQPGLLPEARTALDLLRAEGDRLLVVSAGPGVTAGLERIDLDRAWAGALTMPGKWLARLTALPEDAAPHGALLRIALQQRLPEARIADDTLDNGKWVVIASEQAAEERAIAWERAHLGEVPPGAVSRLLGVALAALVGRRLMERRFGRAALLVLAGLLFGGGVASGLYEMPILGFALVALAVPVIEAFLAISRLHVAPFGKLRGWPFVRHAADAAIFILGIISIDSLAHRVVFPPIMLVSLLILLDRCTLPAWLEPLRDRMLVAALVAVVSAVATPELAIMLAGLLVLAANLVPHRG